MTWSDISGIATGGGTLLLAVATFASVRSADRAARSADRALLASLRPVLIPARLNDGDQKVHWADGHLRLLHGGHALAELDEQTGAVYLGIPLRNTGPGLGVLHAWHAEGRPRLAGAPHAPLSAFQPSVRDLYVPAHDLGYWHAAVRDPQDPRYPGLAEAVRERRQLSVDLLYGDHEGGQRAVTRFALIPLEDASPEDRARGGGWLCEPVRHWNLDRPDPR